MSKRHPAPIAVKLLPLNVVTGCHPKFIQQGSSRKDVLLVLGPQCESRNTVVLSGATLALTRGGVTLWRCGNFHRTTIAAVHAAVSNSQTYWSSHRSGFLKALRECT